MVFRPSIRRAGTVNWCLARRAREGGTVVNLVFLVVLILVLLFVASVSSLQIYHCPDGICISWQS